MTRRAFLTGIGALGASRILAVPAGTAFSGKPKLRFGALSDLHIQCETGDHTWHGGPEVFEHALRYFDEQKVDAVLIAGDLADLGLGKELMLVGQAWDKVFPDNRAADGRHVEKIFITGNHEFGALRWGINAIRARCGNDESEVRRQALMATVESWWEKAFHEPYAIFYHKNVKGYDFLSANWDKGKRLTPDIPLGDAGKLYGQSFGVELKAWLDKNGAKLDPAKPFFYQQHRTLWKTNYADWGWNHDNGLSTEVLSAYPNAVTFSGDTHFSLTDERSVWQGAFTALGTSSLRYCGEPYDSREQFSFENSDTRSRYKKELDPLKTTGNYRPGDSKQGMVVSVYDDFMVFERRDFQNDCSLGDDWVMPLPVAKSSKPYAFEPRAKVAKPAEFAPDAKLAVRRTKAKTRGNKKVKAQGETLIAPVEKDVVEITIPPTVQTIHSRCHEYEVTAIAKDGKRAVFNVLAEGFDCPVGHARTAKPTVFTVSCDRLPAGTVRFEVAPLDCWWNHGKAIRLHTELRNMV